MNDPRKQSVYMEVTIIEEMHAEAARQRRTLSWLAQQAWKLAKDKVRQLPAANMAPWP